MEKTAIPRKISKFAEKNTNRMENLQYSDLGRELGVAFAEKEFAKRKRATVLSNIFRNLKTVGLFALFFYIMLIPTILGIMSYEKSSTGYWCTPLAILIGIISLIIAVNFTPFHDFSIESNLSDREVFRIMREDLKKGYFEKRNYQKRNLLITIALGVLFFLIMKIAVLAWDGVLVPYIGEIANSIIALLSFALPALAYLVIKALSR